MKIDRAWDWKISFTQAEKLTADFTATNKSDAGEILNAVFILAAYDEVGNLKGISFERVNETVSVNNSKSIPLLLEEYNSKYHYKAYVLDSLSELNLLAREEL